MSRNSAPIYLECRSDQPGFPQRHLLTKTEHLRLDVGSWYCDVRAPNGAQASFEIEADGSAQSYREFVRRLEEASGHSDLLRSPLKEGRQSSLEEVAVGAWSEGKMLGEHDWTLAERVREGQSYLVASPIGATQIDYLQFAIVNGVSMIVRCPSKGDVEFQCERFDSIYPVRPLFSVSTVDVTAYWGFSRNGASKAAFRQGQKLADRAIRARSTLGEIVAAAHWAISYGIDDDRLGVIHDRLDEFEWDIDARIMGWILAASLQDKSTEKLTQRFLAIASLVLDDTPIYTGTVRLLSERLPAMVGASRRHISEDNGVRRTFNRLWTLASAMAWDTEYTSFRGIRPDEPDAFAWTAHLDERSKKKCAMVRASS